MLAADPAHGGAAPKLAAQRDQESPATGSTTPHRDAAPLGAHHLAKGAAFDEIIRAQGDMERYVGPIARVSGTAAMLLVIAVVLVALAVIGIVIAIAS